MKRRTIETPFGPRTLIEERGALVRLSARELGHDAGDLLDEAERQLGEYFAGARREFDLPLHIIASDFQKDVCAAMSAIPFGETLTYGDIAKSLGVPAQAIGQACGGNPIPFIIPCHRVLGANGLGGFSDAGGVETKVWLLKHEGAAGLLI